jgi:hypothetical protein
MAIAVADWCSTTGSAVGSCWVALAALSNYDISFKKVSKGLADRVEVSDSGKPPAARLTSMRVVSEPERRNSRTTASRSTIPKQ